MRKIQTNTQRAQEKKMSADIPLCGRLADIAI